jgi:prolyl oligopeptidase
MNPRAPLLLFASLLALAAQGQPNYPATRKTDAGDTLFGRDYPDPYRWLENLKDPEVAAWFKAQGELSESLLSKIPARDSLAAEWMELDKHRPTVYRDIGCEHKRVFYRKTLGGENVGKLYYRESWGGSEKLLFDPTTYEGKTNVTLQSFLASWDVRHVVLGLSSGGAEYSELRVQEVGSGRLLPERFYPSYGAIGWLPDGKSFFYDAGKVADTKSPEIELHRKTRIHQLGSDFDQDVDFFSDEACPGVGIESKEFPQAAIDETYPSLVFGQLGTVQSEARIYVASAARIGKGALDWKPLCQTSDNLVKAWTPYQGWCYAITHTGAPHYKVVRSPLDHPDWTHAETILPEAGDSVDNLVKTKHYLLVAYTDGIKGRLVKYAFATGKVTEEKLPATGTLDISVPDWRSDTCLVTITSWTLPPIRYELDTATDTFAKSRFNTDVNFPIFGDLVSEEVEVPSHDGVRVPLSILHRKDIKLDGSSCCVLEGYGAYGMSYSPYFNIRHSVAAHGVVLAFAHVRGGGEKGEDWYKAGYKTTKPNTWKDFIACAEYLVQHGYTSPAKLAGTGTSAGGILISRAITERPDLFRAAVCNVGCANAMRMEYSPNGPVNVPEFGTVKDETECRALYEMDGVQHVKPGVNYPALLGVCGWNDPRVAPWEPGKFVASVQADTASTNPALLLVNYDNGHFTEEKKVTFRNFASQLAFLLWQTGHPEFQPARSASPP